MNASAASDPHDHPLVGIWVADEGWQIVELLLRSDGRYQIDKKGTEPGSDFASTERGRYEQAGTQLVLASYEWLGEPQPLRYEMQLDGDALTLTTLEYPQSLVYRLKPGSKADVLAREQVGRDLVGAWANTVWLVGRTEYTFRPGGYYLIAHTPEGSTDPPQLVRGRYRHDGTQLAIHPYGGIEAVHETDFYGDTLTLIRGDGTYSESAAFDLVPGSRADVQARAADADAFLAREHWQVGTWEIRMEHQIVDLTLRPDGRYLSKEDTSDVLRGIVRGRYTFVEPRRIRLEPFIGQDLYSRSNGEFGKVERTRELDWFDGELQFIDLEAISPSVTLARKRPGSDAPVFDKVRQAQAERQVPGWTVGIWEVNDPAGWMQFTFRPDDRYIAQAGSEAGSPGHVERGRMRVGDGKLTLAPYAGLGPARGFELDLYDAELFLIGDSHRMVVARKLAGSEAGVIESTRDPQSLKGERGSILGQWSAHLPGHSAELVFRPDGQWRLARCANDVVAHDYGLWQADMAARTLVSDSRFVALQNHGLDFYGRTMTIHGGLGAPYTYTVNLGSVDSAIEASHAADRDEAAVDAQWLARVPVGPRDPDAVHVPTADIPPDPNPGHVFPGADVLTAFALYRRLIPGFVYFNHLGTIRSVAVVNTRAWYFFPTGRVLVRFRNHRAGWSYPQTEVDVSDSWGAYRVEPKPADRHDILHLYADNLLRIETDLGEQTDMTLEDGRRHLFWGKDYQILSEWAAERKPVPCQPPAGDAALMNTGVPLSTTIEPDDIGGA